MISRDTIVDLAKKLQTSEINIAREYCQHTFLRALYQQKQAGILWFKGGTALRLIYKSPRFSEDLDFEHGKKTPHDFNQNDVRLIEDVLTETIEEIQDANVAIDVKEAKPTSGGYLAKIVFRLHEKRVDVLTEFSLRGSKKTNGEPVIITSDFFPTYSVVAVPREQLIEGKLTALLMRKKPRDFFDLYFILRANLLPVFKRSTLKKVIALIPQKPEFFTKELTEFLPSSFHGLLKDFPRLLAVEAGRFVPLV